MKAVIEKVTSNERFKEFSSLASEPQFLQFLELQKNIKDHQDAFKADISCPFFKERKVSFLEGEKQEESQISKEEAVELLCKKWFTKDTFSDLLLMCTREDCLTLIRIFSENISLDMPIYLHFGLSMLLLLKQLDELVSPEELEELQNRWKTLYLDSYLTLAVSSEDVRLQEEISKRWNSFLSQLQDIKVDIPQDLSKNARKKYFHGGLGKQREIKRGEILKKWENLQCVLMNLFQIRGSFDYLCQKIIRAEEGDESLRSFEKVAILFWELGDLFSGGLSQYIQRYDEMADQYLSKQKDRISKGQLKGIVKKASEFMEDYLSLAQLAEHGTELMNAQMQAGSLDETSILEGRAGDGIDNIGGEGLSLEQMVNKALDCYLCFSEKLRAHLKEESIEFKPLPIKSFYMTLRACKKTNLLLLQRNAAFLADSFALFDLRDTFQRFYRISMIIISLDVAENALERVVRSCSDLEVVGELLSQNEHFKWQSIKNRFKDSVQQILSSQSESVMKYLQEETNKILLQIFIDKRYAPDTYDKRKLQEALNGVQEILNFLREQLPIEQLQAAQSDPHRYDQLGWFLRLSVLEFEIKSLLKGSAIEIVEMFEDEILDKLEEDSPFFETSKAKEKIEEPENREPLVISLKEIESESSSSSSSSSKVQLIQKIASEKIISEKKKVRELEASASSSFPQRKERNKQKRAKQEPLAAPLSNTPETSLARKEAPPIDAEKFEQRMHFKRNTKRRKVLRILGNLGFSLTGLGKGSHELLKNEDGSRHVLVSHRGNLGRRITGILNRQLADLDIPDEQPS